MDALYTKQKRKTHTILLPEMMEYHFDLISAAFRNCGYRMEVLNYKNPDIPQMGLNYCHNDICYPCIAITGQLISALKNGIYDPDTTAFLIPQAGGACRAPNYYFLIKNALKEAGFPQVPVISLNLNGKEKHSGFQLSLKLGFSLIAGALYGDLLQALYFQYQAKEVTPGEAYQLYQKWNQRLSLEISKNKSISKRAIRKNTKTILSEFHNIPQKDINLVKVGVAGELYIKSCILGNNNLEEYLRKKNADYFMSGFTTYCLYVADTSLYQFFDTKWRKGFRFIRGIAMRWLDSKQKLIYKPLMENKLVFFSYKEMKKRKNQILKFECSTADGWLVSEEICSLIEAGYTRILVTIPFGCLVSHIASKGIIRAILKKYPEAIISPIEYDSSISSVMQENRILLVLQN